MREKIALKNHKQEHIDWLPCLQKNVRSLVEKVENPLIEPVGSEGASSITFYRCVSCGHTWREIG